jgi:hypothetical protein
MSYGHELEAESIGRCDCCCKVHWLSSKGEFCGVKDSGEVGNCSQESLAGWK